MSNPSAEASRELSAHYARVAEIQERVEQSMLGIKRNSGKPYSVWRLMKAQREDRVWVDAPREAETSARLAEQYGRQPHPGYMFVPTPARRDLTVAGAAGLVASATNVGAGGVFVEAQLAGSVRKALGVQEVPCVGNPAFPTIPTATSTYWLSTEGTAVTESQPAFGAVTGSPKTVGAYSQISEQFLRQLTPGAENYVLAYFGKQVGAAADAALVAGSGASGQPTGVVGTSGVFTQSGTSLTFAGALNCVEQVETANALFSPANAGWIISPASAEILRGREKATGNQHIMTDENTICGYRAFVSNSVPTGRAIFGDFSSVVIPTWGQLEVSVNPYGASAADYRAGIAEIRCLWTIDICVLRPQSFCVVSTIT